MREEHPPGNASVPEAPLEEDAIHFGPRGDVTLRATLIGLGMTLFAFWTFLSDWARGPLDEVFSLFALAFFGGITVLHSVNLIRGRRFGGLLVDGDGFVLQPPTSRAGRIHWHQVKAIYPIERSFPWGLRKDRFNIGIDLTDSFARRNPARMRLGFWLSRRLSLGPDMLISSVNLDGSRDEILTALQDRFREFELHAVMEGKQLGGRTEEPGMSSPPG